MAAVPAAVAHQIRLAQHKITQANARPQGNYDHDVFQWGVIEAIDQGPPLLVSLWPDGAQHTANPAYLIGKVDTDTGQVLPGVAVLAGYVPTVGDVVLIRRGSGNSTSDRVVIGKLNGAASPYPTPLGGINTAGQWVQGPGALWGGAGTPTIPLATATQPGARNGDWYYQTDAAHQFQMQAGAWVQVI